MNIYTTVTETLDQNKIIRVSNSRKWDKDPLGKFSIASCVTIHEERDLSPKRRTFSVNRF